MQRITVGRGLRECHTRVEGLPVTLVIVTCRHVWGRDCRSCRD
jgi:hypothetical protein